MITAKLVIRKPTPPAGVLAELHLPVFLGRSTAQLGKDEEIERYIAEETEAGIPKIKDRELIRLRLDPQSGESRLIVPTFRSSGGTLVNSYQAAGFSDIQAKTLTQGLARSMYIFEIFDSADTDNQTLLSRSYTKGDDVNTYFPVLTTGGTVTNNLPLLQFATTGNTPTTISPISLPVYFVNDNPTGTVYLLVSFFNSTTGKRSRLRRALTGLSIADNRYIPLTYDATTRKYHFPTAGIITMEEVPVALTSAEAEAERKKRLTSMTANATLGNFEPLGPPNPVVYFPTTGVTSTTTSSGSTTTGNTTPTIITRPIANTVITTTGFTYAYQAFAIPSTQPATTGYTTTGQITAGQPIYYGLAGAQPLPDGYYAYVVNGVFPPPKVFRVSGAVVTEVDVQNPDTVNIQLASDMLIDLTRYTTGRNVCNGGVDPQNTAPVYTTGGITNIGKPIYTGPNFTGRLVDGYYWYSNTATGVDSTLRILAGVVSDLDLDCSIYTSPGPVAPTP